MLKLERCTQNGFIEQEEYYNNSNVVTNLRNQLSNLEQPQSYPQTGEAMIAENVVKDLKVALFKDNKIAQINKNFDPVDKFLEQYQWHVARLEKYENSAIDFDAIQF